MIRFSSPVISINISSHLSHIYPNSHEKSGEGENEEEGGENSNNSNWRGRFDPNFSPLSTHFQCESMCVYPHTEGGGGGEDGGDDVGGTVCVGGGNGVTMVDSRSPSSLLSTTACHSKVPPSPFYILIFLFLYLLCNHFPYIVIFRL